MFVINILAEFVNRSTCIYPISCLRLFMLIFISSISCFMLHLVYLVTAMDVSIGNRTLWSVLPVQVRLYFREIIWVVRLNMYINIRIIMWYFYVV